MEDSTAWMLSVTFSSKQELLQYPLCFHVPLTKKKLYRVQIWQTWRQQSPDYYCHPKHSQQCTDYLLLQKHIGSVIIRDISIATATNSKRTMSTMCSTAMSRWASYASYATWADKEQLATLISQNNVPTSTRRVSTNLHQLQQLNNTEMSTLKLWKKKATHN